MLADNNRLNQLALTQSVAAKVPCSDGCGLSAHGCDLLHARIVAYVRARLMAPLKPGKEARPWPKAA